MALSSNPTALRIALAPMLSFTKPNKPTFGELAGPKEASRRRTLNNFRENFETPRSQCLCNKLARFKMK
jgi:hypothetical protein